MDNADDRNAHSDSPNTSLPRQKTPSRVSLPSLHTTPLRQRFRIHFSQTGRPVQSTARKLAWISLDGRLVESETATSAKAIGGGLSRKETLAWELFSPLHRVLLVAVVAAASAESKKAREISVLQRSIELRDQVLHIMQQKLEKLCQQMSPVKVLPLDNEGTHISASTQTSDDNISVPEGWDQYNLANDFLPCDNGVVTCKIPDRQEDPCAANLGSEDMSKATEMNISWPEERRMSDLSDFCSSVASHSEIHSCILGSEQSCCKLKTECEEKDALIKELRAATQESDLARQKRIVELEDVIKRKNLVISKLKKDIVFLEQKVIQLTRMRRPTYMKADPTQNSWDLPVMTNNILYDMSSSSSSSDSDSTKNSNGGRQSSTSSDDCIKEDATGTGSLGPQPPSRTILLGTRSFPERIERQGTRQLGPVRKIISNNAQSVVRSSANQKTRGEAVKKTRRDIQESKNIVRNRRV